MTICIESLTFLIAHEIIMTQYHFIQSAHEYLSINLVNTSQHDNGGCDSSGRCGFSRGK